jgi:hypothetical protein
MTPGMPGKSTEIQEGEAHQRTQYRIIVGKTMYLVCKTSARRKQRCYRELSRQFGNQNKEHWKEVERSIGYLMEKKDKLKLGYRKARAMPPGSNIDCNSVVNKDDWQSASGALVMVGSILVSWLSKPQESTTLEYDGGSEMNFLLMSVK